eukprot:TRINITY_DN29706_c0_g1_i1.p3 TRINITY_DN29706_c0_g1~~TRINITY_DN29706_c0_g1_i1.p3  ORF type:complete len:246 (-),score=69.10 TRINITY_DN29706_c0_g1_i1:195-932(-)
MFDLPPELVAEMKEIFDGMCDSRGMTTRELGTVMRTMGQSLTEAELQDLITTVDVEGNGSIDFKEFLNLMTKRLPSADPEEELSEAFRDIDIDGDGLLTAEELKQMMESLAERASEFELAGMVREVSGQVLRVRVSGAEVERCNGLFQQSGERGGRPCFTREGGRGALYFDGASHWKLGPDGQGSTATTWKYSQMEGGRGLLPPLGPWTRDLRHADEQRIYYGELKLAAPEGVAMNEFVATMLGK